MILFWFVITLFYSLSYCTEVPFPSHCYIHFHSVCVSTVELQRQLKHPFIHNLQDCWQTQRHLFLSELLRISDGTVQPLPLTILLVVSPSPIPLFVP